jgi:hypothetical protein
MRFSTFSLLASLAASAVAEDLLFIDSLKYQEYTEATEVDGFTAKVVTEAEWRAMSTADFAAFKAIILSDPMGSSDTTILQFLEDTKAVWSPAILGNMILIGNYACQEDTVASHVNDGTRWRSHKPLRFRAWSEGS